MFPSKYPIIQAPMAGVTTPKLAAAVSNAGGLGSLGLAGQSVEKARNSILETQKLTQRPFNVNFFCFDLPPSDPAANYAWIKYLGPLFQRANLTPPKTLKPVYATFDKAMLEVVCELRPKVVSFHFGHPGSEAISRLKAAGCELYGTATNLEEAKTLEKYKFDAIVAQGIEAGGHRGTFDPDAKNDPKLSTLQLVQLLHKHVTIPIIAAGGLVTPRDVQAVISAGASAVQLGTAFISCPESTANDAYRAHLQSGGTILQRVVSGRYARGFTNPFVEYATSVDAPNAPPFPYAYDAQKQLAASSSEFINQWSGSSTPGPAKPAAEVVADFVACFQ